jgi:hypothetical protein
VYKDYSNPAGPLITEFNVNIDEKYTNVTDPNTVVSLIVFNALARTAISELANFNLGLVKGSITDAFGTANKILQGTGADAQKILNQAEGILQGLPFGATKEQQ